MVVCWKNEETGSLKLVEKFEENEYDKDFTDNNEEKKEESESIFSETSFQPDGRFAYRDTESEYGADSPEDTDESDADGSGSEDNSGDGASSEAAQVGQNNVRQKIQQYEALLVNRLLKPR